MHKHMLSSSSCLLLQYPYSGANRLEYMPTALSVTDHCLPLLAPVVHCKSNHRLSYGTSLVNIMECAVAILKDLR